MNTDQKLAILHFERGFIKIQSKLDETFSSGFVLNDFRTKKVVNLDYMLISEILELDFEELYSNKEVLVNCMILDTEFLKPLGFTWWNLGDSLVDIVYQFCSSDDEINECSLTCLENMIKILYNNYLLLVKLELPPPIPKGV